MAGMRVLRSMAYDDEELSEMEARRSGDTEEELPEHPPGLRFTIQEFHFGSLGIGEATPGASVNFAAFVEATSVSHQEDGCRVEAEITAMSLDDSPFVDLDEGARPYICLDRNDHVRLDCEEACQRGDTLHLIGSARVVSVDDNRYVGRSLTLQITDAVVEDENQEARDAGY